MADSYASARPTFAVNGQDRPDLAEALTGLTVNLPLSGSAHAEMHVTQWGIPEGASDPDFLFDDLGLGAGVDIFMGQDDPQRLFRGEITGIEERYGDGPPALVLLLQDKLHRLARSRHSRAFEDQSPDQVVQRIAGEAGLSSDASVSSLTATWHQLNESDLAFLLRLLGRFGIALRLDDDRLRARPEAQDPEPVALDVQDSVIQLRLLADLNHQPTASTAQGYNLASAEAVDHTTRNLRPPPAGTTAAQALGDLGWAGEEIVPEPFPRSSAEAEGYAEAHFRRQAQRFIHGDLVCQGEAGLRSGREIELAGVAPRLRGRYQVVHCVHRFDNAAGFETHLRVHKAGWTP
jgi:phage protein D